MHPPRIIILRPSPGGYAARASPSPRRRIAPPGRGLLASPPKGGGATNDPGKILILGPARPRAEGANFRGTEAPGNSAGVLRTQQNRSAQYNKPQPGLGIAQTRGIFWQRIDDRIGKEVVC